MFIHRGQWIKLYTILKILGITCGTPKKRTFRMLKSVEGLLGTNKKLNGLNKKTSQMVVDLSTF